MGYEAQDSASFVAIPQQLLHGMPRALPMFAFDHFLCNEPANVALGMEGQKWVWLQGSCLHRATS